MKMYKTYKQAMKAVKEDGYKLSLCSDKLKDNFDIVLEAVKEWPQSIRYASPRMKDNATIIRTALEINQPAAMIGIVDYLSVEMQIKYRKIAEKAFFSYLKKQEKKDTSTLAS